MPAPGFDGESGQSEAAGSQLLQLIGQLEFAVRAHLDEITGTFGLTAQQYVAMTLVARSPGITCAQLARDTLVRPQSMSQTMGYLEQKGLISRERGPDSRRELLQFMTPAGQSALEWLRAPVAGIEEMLTAKLTEDQVRGFRFALQSGRESLGRVDRR